MMGSVRCMGRLKTPVPWWRKAIGLGAYRCLAKATIPDAYMMDGKPTWYCRRHTSKVPPSESLSLDELARAQGVTPATPESLAAMGDGLPDDAFDGFDEALDESRHPERHAPATIEEAEDGPTASR